MRRPRTLAALALALLATCLAAGVPSASAVDPFPTTGVATLASQHFMIHYSRDDTDTSCGNFITQEKAGDILGMLERAWTYYSDPLKYKLGVQYPAPLPDTDGYVHVSVDDFGVVCVPRGAIPGATPIPWSRWDALAARIAPGTDDIHLNAVASGLTYHAIAHEVFQLVEDAMVPDVDPWLQTGTAEWAATRASEAAGGTEANPDRTLDCVGSECGDTEYDKNGYPGWMLFEFFAERYGDSKVKAVWDQAAANPVAAGTTDLANVLPVSLASFFNDYTTARLTGNFTYVLLAGQLPTPYAELPVGSTSSDLDGGNVALNHLAVRYIVISHGTDTASPCFAASLKINVGIPEGVTSFPYYYANTNGSSAQALTVSGSSASITVPWNTCGGSPDAYLSLPNDSLGLDGREFTVGGHVDVTSAPASPSDPPPGAHVIGSPIPAPTSDPAPTLKVYAPEVIRVSAKTRLLRFAVFSSGDGKLQATLGSTSLGSASLRGGNNDVRFLLPTALFKSLRRTSAANLLSLTSVSPGGARGSTVTRRVLVQPAKKPKPKRR